MNFEAFADRLLWFLAAGITAALSWFGRMVLDRIEVLRKDMVTREREIAELRAQLPVDYVKRAEFDKRGDVLFERLRAIEAHQAAQDEAERVLAAAAAAPARRASASTRASSKGGVR